MIAKWIIYVDGREFMVRAAIHDIMDTPIRVMAVLPICKDDKCHRVNKHAHNKGAVEQLDE